MADGAGETDLYEYLYGASSRLVHFSPHELLRRVWFEPDGTLDVGSGSLERLWASIALGWGVFLLSQTTVLVSQIVQSVDIDEDTLERIVVTGADALEAIPPLIVLGELNMAPGQPRWPGDQRGMNRGLLGTESFPTTPAGYASLLAWLCGFGTVTVVGIEGTGSYGAGLARHLARAGVAVVEVDRADRTERRRAGKSDTLDAVSAARAALSGRARGAPKGRDGTVEAIRALMVAKRSARGERTQTINQARALVVTGPDDIRVRFAAHSAAGLVAELAAMRPRPGEVVGYSTRMALRELGRRAEFLGDQIDRLDELIVPLVTAHAPGLLGLYGVGPHIAAMLLVAAGDHPERLRSEAAWAHLCAAAPIPASSGKTNRHRLNPGGDRQANHALWRIVFTRMGSHPSTRVYVERRTKEGKSKLEIIRCLKRYVAREVYPHLRPAPG